MPVLVAAVVLSLCMSVGQCADLQGRQQSRQAADSTGYRVLVELFKMSRCPDAQRVEAAFQPVMDQVHALANIRFHYIGAVNHAAAATVVCKHGEKECDGNKQQLCVQHYAGNGADNYNSLWQFVKCQDDNADRIGELSLAEECLNQTVTDVDTQEKIRRCYTGSKGDVLLLGDVERVKALDVTRSCTIFINRKKRCVHDNSTWYDCPAGHETADFVNSICDAYVAKSGRLPAQCETSHHIHNAVVK